MVIESLDKELSETAHANEINLKSVNEKFRAHTCDKSNPEEIDQADRGNLLERFQCGEFGEFLRQDPLQVDTKYFNSLELKFFDNNDWAIQESIFE